MFTGLIEEVGTILAVELSEAGSIVTVEAQTIMNDVNLGDSIAIDGVCTTVVRFNDRSFVTEISPETLSKTVMKNYAPGQRVNLERPLLPTSRLGGHFVTGHVDGVATVISRVREGISWIYHFKLASPEMNRLFIEKGSVAISGISLTVNAVMDDVFSVAIIPHTLEHTNIGDLVVGDTVNIETDMLGKYVERFVALGHTQDILQKQTSPLTQ